MRNYTQVRRAAVVLALLGAYRFELAAKGSGKLVFASAEPPSHKQACVLRVPPRPLKQFIQNCDVSGFQNLVLWSVPAGSSLPVDRIEMRVYAGGKLVFSAQSDTDAPEFKTGKAFGLELDANSAALAKKFYRPKNKIAVLALGKDSSKMPLDFQVGDKSKLK